MDDDLGEPTDKQRRESRVEALARRELPAYEQDEGPLSEGDLTAVREAASVALPKGAIVGSRSFR